MTKRGEYCSLVLKEEEWREEYCSLVHREERRVYCSLVYNDREGGILFFSSESRDGWREGIYCSLVHRDEVCTQEKGGSSSGQGWGGRGLGGS